MTKTEAEKLKSIFYSVISTHANSLDKTELLTNELYKKFLPKWKPDTLYKFGDRVVDNDKIYSSKLTAMSGTLHPAENTDQWEELVQTEEWPEFAEGKTYQKGDKITYQNKHYICIYEQGTVQWNPDDFPEGWTVIE